MSKYRQLHTLAVPDHCLQWSAYCWTGQRDVSSAEIIVMTDGCSEQNIQLGKFTMASQPIDLG